MIKKDNFIIIGSSGRNSGKTEFACRIISQHAKKENVIALKVKRVCTDKEHCDNLCKNCHIGRINEKGFEIIQESDASSNKDTSRMLAAGASKSFLLRCETDKLQEGFNELLRRLSADSIVVCESNWLRNFFNPGLYILVKNNSGVKEKQSYLNTMHYADRIVNFENLQWDFQPERINFIRNKWIIREQACAIILAGGKSLRMQGLDKSMLPVEGIPMISHIVSQLREHFDEMIIGANDLDKYRFLELPVVPDIEAGKGPLMGILSCLKASQFDANFITACDIPVMNTAFIHRLLSFSKEKDIVIPVSENRFYEPLFAVYSKSVIPYIEDLLMKGKGKIIELLNYANVKEIEFNPNLWYRNLNLKEDYLNFRKESGIMNL